MKKVYRELLELKGKLREKKITYNQMAKELGISVSTFSDKMNGKAVFDILEVSKIVVKLDILREEINIYFF